MTLRQLLNVAYAHVTKGMTTAELKTLNETLEEKFDYEMTPTELARAQRRRKAIETGAYQSQGNLVGAMGMQTGRRARPV